MNVVLVQADVSGEIEYKKNVSYHLLVEANACMHILCYSLYIIQQRDFCMHFHWLLTVIY